MSTSARVVVIGGGILGVSAARHLAMSGTSVTLVTQGAVADGASGRSLSWLNSSGARSEPYHRLRQLGMDRYRTYLARHDARSYLRFDGGLTWAAEGLSLREEFAHEQAIGYDAVWLGANEVEHWTPGVEPSAIAAEGAVFHPGEGWVDIPSLLLELVAELRARGGRVVEHAGRADLVVEGDRVVAVTTAAGERYPADAALLATGPAVPSDIAGWGVAVPELTPSALLVWTKPVATQLSAVLNTPRVSVRPTPWGGLALDSGWSEAALITDAGEPTIVPDGIVDELLAETSRVLAGRPDVELDRVGVGPKPIPGDGEPVLGELDEVAGCFVAFTHSGATLGLIAGELLAREIVTGQTSRLLEAFRPRRFALQLRSDE